MTDITDKQIDRAYPNPADTDDGPPYDLSEDELERFWEWVDEHGESDCCLRVRPMDADPARLTVTYRCPHCGDAWTVAGPDPALILDSGEPDPDEAHDLMGEI